MGSMEIPEYSYKLDFKVRDSECDLEGVVNNSFYHVYLEHARHEFVKEAGIDFAAMVSKGINLMLVRAEVDYKHPLVSGDNFWVGVSLRRSSRIRMAFDQDIYRHPDNKLVASAVMTAVAVNSQGRPFRSMELEEMLHRIAPGEGAVTEGSK